MSAPLNLAKVLHGEHIRCLLSELAKSERPDANGFAERRRLHRHVARYTNLHWSDSYDLTSRMLRDVVEDESGGKAMMRLGLFTAEKVEPLTVVEALRILGASTGHLSDGRSVRCALVKRLAYDAAVAGDEYAMTSHLREAQRLLGGG